MVVRVKHFAAVLGLVCSLCASSPAGDFQVYEDPQGDAVLRETARGRVKPEKHRLPDLLSITIGTWQPADPPNDLFTGVWNKNAEKPFLRVDILLDGLMNPPGTLRFGGEGSFEPFRFGPHPVFGFIELDADSSIDTGGELKAPENRLLGVAARFGGIPGDVPRKLKERFALSGDDLDNRCKTPPRVEYSGEEFHIALLGEEYRGHVVVVENREGKEDEFDAGEIWDLEKGTWFHRAHGFKEFSATCPHEGVCPGDELEGEYKPYCTLRWAHDSELDRTTISLVFPLTHRAAKAMRGDPQEEPLDQNYRNQTSVHEALTDLLFSARADPEGPCVDIILEWANTDPQDFLKPQNWRVDATLSMSFVREVKNAYFVWTDLYPNVLGGDFNGDGDVDLDDYRLLYGFIRDNDGGEIDCDGVINGEICLRDFPKNFSVFDVVYDIDDGIVGREDASLVILPHDLDQDLDIDLEDLRTFVVSCFKDGSGPRLPDPPLGVDCIVADSDFDADVDLADFRLFQQVFTGPSP